jgi:group I intron endonuclease
MKVRIKAENLNQLKEKGVYRIFNVISHKNYVGSTWKSFKTRWKQHLSKLNTNNHHSHEMQNAFNKYGTDSFVCEILEVITDESKLLEREAYYIEKYDSFYNGYNENPIPSRSPMLNKNSREKSSKTHKEFWENLEKNMSEEELKQYKKEYAEHRGLGEGYTPWNKGTKMSEKQTINMRKPKINGVSKAMKEVHIKNSQKMKDKADYVLVYDSDHKWLNTFWCNSDLVNYSKSEFNNLPMKLRKNGIRSLDPSKIANHIKDGKAYKGLYFKRAPKSWKLSYANAENSWKAETEPIMSQAESTLSEGAETTGEV